MQYFTKLDYPIGRGKALASVEHEGFTLVACWEPDQSPDYSYYGGFTDEKNGHTPGHIIVDQTPDQRFATQSKYFCAANVENAEEAQQNYQRVCAFVRDEWMYVGLLVKVKRCGIELTSNSVWNVESDCDEAHTLEVLNDMAADALAGAKEVLGALCSCVPNPQIAARVAYFMRNVDESALVRQINAVERAALTFSGILEPPIDAAVGSELKIVGVLLRQLAVAMRVIDRVVVEQSRSHASFKASRQVRKSEALMSAYGTCEEELD